MNLYIKKSQTDCFEAIVADQLLCKYPESDMYSLQGADYSDYCVHLMHNPENILTDKIFYMAAHQPKGAENNPNLRICLPMAAVYNSEWKCVGYMTLMPFEGSLGLSLLTSYNARPISKRKRFASKPEWHDKFERDEVGMQNRYKLLYNVVKALHLVPECYSIANLTPEEILITPKGKVSIIGLYNTQIAENGKVLFPMRSITPDYFAPEAYKARSAKEAIPASAGLFSVAVYIYQVLTGTHPYAGTVLRPPYDSASEISDCIKNDLFPFGERKQYITLPDGLNLHKAFESMPADIQQLFKQAFSSNYTSRPTLEQWGKTIYNTITR